MNDHSAFLQDNIVLVVLLAGLTVAIAWTFVASRIRPFKMVNTTEATRLVNGDATVIDLRGDGDYRGGHIIGARNLPDSRFAELLEKTPDQVAKDRAAPVLLVCASGQSATGAASRLTKAGFSDVRVLQGGMAEWKSAGLPVHK